MNNLSAIRVLVVEDEYFIADELAGALSQAGAVVIGPVSDAASAMDRLNEAPELAVLDINLAGTISFDLADELTRRGIPFVFTTGYDRSTIPERYRNVPHWPKPFDVVRLVDSLSGVSRT
jgi:CheY-like chemotaxis protein